MLLKIQDFRERYAFSLVKNYRSIGISKCLHLHGQAVQSEWNMNSCIAKPWSWKHYEPSKRR